MPRIMIVDDDINSAKSLGRIFKREPEYQVDIFFSAEDALDNIRTTDYDVVISDLRMPGNDGITFLAMVKEKQPGASRIIISGFCDRDTLHGAINIANAGRYIHKPCEPEIVKAIVVEVLSERKAVYAVMHQQRQIN